MKVALRGCDRQRSEIPAGNARRRVSALPRSSLRGGGYRWRAVADHVVNAVGSYRARTLTFFPSFGEFHCAPPSCHVVRTGCAWRRLLPGSFPPWREIYKAFSRWAAAGTFEAMHDHGTQAPLGVDTLGLLLAVTITSASVQDRNAAAPVAARAVATVPGLQKLYTDAACAGQCVMNIGKAPGRRARPRLERARPAHCGPALRRPLADPLLASQAQTPITFHAGTQ